MRVDDLVALITQARRIGRKEIDGKGGYVRNLPTDFEDLVRLAMDLNTRVEVPVTMISLGRRLHEDGPSTLEEYRQDADATATMELDADNRKTLVIGGVRFERFALDRDEPMWWTEPGAVDDDFGVHDNDLKALFLEFRTLEPRTSTEA